MPFGKSRVPAHHTGRMSEMKRRMERVREASRTLITLVSDPRASEADKAFAREELHRAKLALAGPSIISGGRTWQYKDYTLTQDPMSETVVRSRNGSASSFKSAEQAEAAIDDGSIRVWLEGPHRDVSDGAFHGGAPGLRSQAKKKGAHPS